MGVSGMSITPDWIDAQRTNFMSFVISIPIFGVKPRNGLVHWDKNRTHMAGQVTIIFRNISE